MQSLKQSIVMDDDLWLAARLNSGLKNLGFENRILQTAEALPNALSSVACSLILVNGAAKKWVMTDNLRTIRDLAPAAKVVVYFSHTRIPEVRGEVLVAGADRIVANSVISSKLQMIVERVMQDAPPTAEETD